MQGHTLSRSRSLFFTRCSELSVLDDETHDAARSGDAARLPRRRPVEPIAFRPGSPAADSSTSCSARGLRDDPRRASRRPASHQRDRRGRPQLPSAARLQRVDQRGVGRRHSRHGVLVRSGLSPRPAEEGVRVVRAPVVRLRRSDLRHVPAGLSAAPPRPRRRGRSSPAGRVPRRARERLVHAHDVRPRPSVH